MKASIKGWEVSCSLQDRLYEKLEEGNVDIPGNRMLSQVSEVGIGTVWAVWTETFNVKGAFGVDMRNAVEQKGRGRFGRILKPRGGLV